MRLERTVNEDLIVGGTLAGSVGAAGAAGAHWRHANPFIENIFGRSGDYLESIPIISPEVFFGLVGLVVGGGIGWIYSLRPRGRGR